MPAFPESKKNYVGDSYMADPDDLKLLRAIAKKTKVSKGTLIRHGVRLAILDYEKNKGA